MPRAVSPERERNRARLLLFSVLVVATCGLVYELISATMASYLLGDSITQFSLVIGVYLSAMGLGSWLSKYIERDIERWFVHVQLVIAIVGGFSATLLFFGFAWMSSVRPLLFSLLIIVGTMVGLEIPLLMRLMPKSDALKDVVARVLAVDYLGALVASIVFPLLLLPTLGLVRTALLFGTLNAVVAAWTAHAFKLELRRPRRTLGAAIVVALVLFTALITGARIEAAGERNLFDAPVVLSEKSPYQRLTVTRWNNDVRLFINGNLQFSSLDEHRYHEALVHPAVAAAAHPRRALVLGGGDGMAARELLRYESIESIDLVDLDPAMTRLFSENAMLVALNAGSLTDERLTVHNRDAMRWLEARVASSAAPYDVVIIDLPDPNNFALGKLYSRSFYRLVSRVIGPDGAGVVQATSPYFAPRSYWCIVRTLEEAGLSVAPYHAHVPSFGDWGYALIGHRSLRPVELRTEVPMRFLTPALLHTLFEFPADQQRVDVDSNRLNDQLLVHYYESDLQGQEFGGAR